MDIQECSVQSCTDNIVDVELEVDEGHSVICSSSSSDLEFDAVIGRIEEIIIDEEFQLLQQSFMEKHYLEFEDTDENRLSYMPIFSEYISLLENYLEEQLMKTIPEFNMHTFTELLKHRKDEVPEEITDMLLTFTDFMTFKMMFLDYKADKEGRCLNLSQALVVTPLKSTGCKNDGSQ